MPEILTESFCERCGTRYTFESAAPRATRLKGVKVLSRGLKNFVMSDDTTLDEAMAAARSDTDREVTAQQLDAFHKTFNFCMQCRQYTCANCWNEAEGRCLTCAPHLGQDILEAPFPTLAVSPSLDLRPDSNGNGTNGHHHDPALDSLAWPTSDLMRDALEADVVDETVPLDDIEPIDAVARLAALDAEPDVDEPPTAMPSVEEPAAEAIEVAAPDAIEAPAAAPTGPSDPEPIADASPVEAAGPALTDIEQRAAAAAAATADLLRSFRPGQSLDAALEAFEREQAAGHVDELVAAPEPEPEPVVAAAPEPEPEPIVAAAPEPEPEPEPVEAAAPEPEPVVAAAPDPEPEPAPARPTDHVEQPTWRIVAPDPQAPTPSAPEPAGPADQPIAASAEPQWPSQPQWPTRAPSAGLPFLGRPATPTGGMEALWAESAREVSSVPTSGPAALAPVGEVRAAGGVQPCVSCGLSLSATARFCRRCGSRQG